MAPQVFTLLESDDPDWVKILNVPTLAEDAQFIHPETCLTPLHLAVMAKPANLNPPARLGVIRALIQADLSATEEVCEKRGWTPLMYACQVHDLEELEFDANVVKLLIEANSDSFALKSPDGHSALDIHILSMSRLQQELKQQQQVQQQAATTSRHGKKSLTNCTAVLKVLLEEYNSDLSLPQTLDFLLSCNSLEVMEHLAQAEAKSFMLRLCDRRKQRNRTKNESAKTSSTHNGSRHLETFWVWTFVLTMLRIEHEQTFSDAKPIPPFDALYTASQIDDFPPAFFMLCMRAYPGQVMKPNIIQSDLPVHSVARWDVSCDSKAARKSIMLTQLLSDHPSTSRARNDHGKTPLSLAIESETAWNLGVKRMTVAQKEGTTDHYGPTRYS